MPQSTAHITTSGGLISAAFIETIRELDRRQAGTEPECFAMPGRLSRTHQGEAPHDVLQALRNGSSDGQWAVLSKGTLLCVARDYRHIFTEGHIRFAPAAM